jgi:hypothetical protein
MRHWHRAGEDVTYAEAHVDDAVRIGAERCVVDVRMSLPMPAFIKQIQEREQAAGVASETLVTAENDRG